MKKQTYQTPRRGYTLMEMLLVQGVIVALVAMSWPALRGSLDKNRLLAAARQVRTELVQARLKAAETGVAQQFRYQTGDRCYEVAATNPVAGLEAAAKKDRASSFAVAAPNRDESVDDEDGDTRLAMLDEEIAFIDARAVDSDEQHEFNASTSQDDAVDSKELGEENWSPPVVFLPNGRSNNARVRLSGPRGFHVDVTLRGLTGAVTVGELTREEDSE